MSLSDESEANASPPRGWAQEVEDLSALLRQLGTNFESSYRQLSSFGVVLDRVNRGVRIEEIAEHLYQTFREFLPYDRVDLVLIDEAGTSASPRWTRIHSGRLDNAGSVSIALAPSLLADVLTAGRPRSVSHLGADLTDDPVNPLFQGLLTDGMLSTLVCPLAAESRPVGFLLFSCKRSDAFQTEHVTAIENITGTLSVILEKAQLYDRLANLNHHLQKHIGALQLANERIERLTLTDELTGVANRRAMSRTLEAAISYSVRHEQPLSVLMLDMDRFKPINDVHGHEAGDGVLRETAVRLIDSCRVEDTVARFGGEEFIVVLPATSAAAAIILAERICRRIADRPFLDGKLTVTASLGVAELRPGEDADSLLRRVDERLYEAKKGGRNQVVPKVA